MLGLAALVLAHVSSLHALWFLLALCAAGYLVLRGLGFVRVNLQDTPRMLEVRRRNLEVRSSIRRVGAALREARGMGDVWSGVQLAAAVLGARAVAMQLPERAANDDELTVGFDDAGSDLFRARYSILADGPALAISSSAGKTAARPSTGTARSRSSCCASTSATRSSGSTVRSRARQSRGSPAWSGCDVSRVAVSRAARCAFPRNPGMQR